MTEKELYEVAVKEARKHRYSRDIQEALAASRYLYNHFLSDRLYRLKTEVLVYAFREHLRIPDREAMAPELRSLKVDREEEVRRIILEYRLDNILSYISRGVSDLYNWDNDIKEYKNLIEKCQKKK